MTSESICLTSILYCLSVINHQSLKNSTMFSKLSKIGKSIIFISLQIWYLKKTVLWESLEVKEQPFYNLIPTCTSSLSPAILVRPDFSPSLNIQSMHFHAAVVTGFFLTSLPRKFLLIFQNLVQIILLYVTFSDATRQNCIHTAFVHISIKASVTLYHIWMLNSPFHLLQLDRTQFTVDGK